MFVNNDVGKLKTHQQLEMNADESRCRGVLVSFSGPVMMMMNDGILKAQGHSVIHAHAVSRSKYRYNRM